MTKLYNARYFFAWHSSSHPYGRIGVYDTFDASLCSLITRLGSIQILLVSVDGTRIWLSSVLLLTKIYEDGSTTGLPQSSSSCSFGAFRNCQTGEKYVQLKMGNTLNQIFFDNFRIVNVYFLYKNSVFMFTYFTCKWWETFQYRNKRTIYVLLILWKHLRHT